MRTTTIKSERAAKIQMTKLDRAYDEALAKRNDVTQAARESGWSEEDFAAERAAQDEMNAIYEQMVAHCAAAKALGFYAGGSWLRYFGSATTALIAANID